MMVALDRAGCTVTPHRHFVCEECNSGENVFGGYDVKVNQVVICSNRCRDEDKVAEILFHELVHMYDFCTAKIDFSNLSHLACTEIRAANLGHCKTPTESPFGNRENCVKDRAAASVRAMTSVDAAVAMKAVTDVFKRCNADVEPVGRRTTGPDCEGLALRDFLHFKQVLLAQKPP
jgi:inner membrane protease ATP23